MQFRAIRDCTDFDGIFYNKGEVVGLDSTKAHSKYLVPLKGQTVVAPPKKSAAAKEAINTTTNTEPLPNAAATAVRAKRTNKAAEA